MSSRGQTLRQNLPTLAVFAPPRQAPPAPWYRVSQACVAAVCDRRARIRHNLRRWWTAATARRRWKNPWALAPESLASQVRQRFPQSLLAGEQLLQLLIVFGLLRLLDIALHAAEFPFELAPQQGGQARPRLFERPEASGRRLGARFKRQLVEQPPLPLAHPRGPGVGPGPARERHAALRQRQRLLEHCLEPRALVRAGVLELRQEVRPDAFVLDEDLQQPPLGGLHPARLEHLGVLRLELHLRAAPRPR